MFIHLGHFEMRTSTFRLTPLDTLGLLFLGGTGDRGQGTRDGGQWEQVEVRDTASNTLESIGHTPLGLILLGEDRGPGTGDWGPGKGYNIL